jgi:hypothetical protein
LSTRCASKAFEPAADVHQLAARDVRGLLGLPGLQRPEIPLHFQFAHFTEERARLRREGGASAFERGHALGDAVGAGAWRRLCGEKERGENDAHAGGHDGPEPSRMSQVFLRQRDSVEPCQGTLVDTLARSGCGVASIRAHMRVVGVDVGTRRIGLAVSDPSGTLARPLGVVSVAALDTPAIASRQRVASAHCATRTAASRRSSSACRGASTAVRRT